MEFRIHRLDKMALKENLIGNEEEEHKSVDPGFIRELYKELKETYDGQKKNTILHGIPAVISINQTINQINLTWQAGIKGVPRDNMVSCIITKTFRESGV